MSRPSSSRSRRGSPGGRGIIAAGNWIRDHVKVLDAWPAQDALANILGHSVANGGGPYNLLKDLSRLGAPFPLAAVGRVGDDADGLSVIAECRALGIDTGQLRASPGIATSTTDVMSVRATGRRTFFHDRGANAHLRPADIRLGGSTHRIFYLGYLLLLDRLDEAGPGGAPRARQVLRSARANGLLTAVDCVSAERARFRQVVLPVLPEADILFVNDYEAEQLTGIALGRGSSLDPDAVRAAGRRLVEEGVRGWAIIHFPEGACATPAAGGALWQPSVRVPSPEVRGSAGAGDAFAAGVLLGIHEGWEMGRSLELGVCAAAASLRHPTCSEGVGPAGRCLALGRRWGFRRPPRPRGR
jgi:sugar/nucleoside kinase (ribokinase family)